jgi:hypothetical protein
LITGKSVVLPIKNQLTKNFIFEKGGIVKIMPM